MSPQLKPKALAALTVLCTMTAAHAETDTSSFDVLLQITEACDVSSTAPNDLDFGTTSLLTGNLDQTSTLTVLCTTGTTFDIGLDAGINESSVDDISTRRMTDGDSSYVGYQLYQDAGRSVAWGDTVSTNTVSSTGTGDDQSFTVYGRVPTQITPAAGSYTDNVTVTVTY